MNYSKYKKGYTLLFSIIVSSVVLSIAAFILSISRKQFILSSSARDSTVAVYAADGGIQCAVGAKMEKNLEVDPVLGGNAIITCNLETKSGAYSEVNPDDLDADTGLNDSPIGKVYRSAPIFFYFPNNTDPDRTCVKIVVTSGYNSSNGKRVIIDSSGYSAGDSKPCNSGGPINPRALERTIRLKYFD